MIFYTMIESKVDHIKGAIPTDCGTNAFVKTFEAKTIFVYDGLGNCPCCRCCSSSKIKKIKIVNSILASDKNIPNRPSKLKWQHELQENVWWLPKNWFVSKLYLKGEIGCVLFNER